MISYFKHLTLTTERTNVPFRRCERGYALPGVLVVSTMISLLVLIVAELHREVVLLTRDTKEILLDRRRPILLSGITSESSECIPFTEAPVVRLLCITAPRAFKTIPRLPPIDERRFIDFNTLFARPDTCSHTVVSTSSINGRLPTSLSTCNVHEHASDRVIIKESLLAKKFNLLPSKNRTAALLASLGDIQIQNDLVLSTDSVVLAAGSIRIKGISSSDSSQRRVTLIANAGDVTIEQVSSAVFPLVFGRGALNIPSVRLNPPYPMVIEKRQNYINGIMKNPISDGRW